MRVANVFVFLLLCTGIGYSQGTVPSAELQNLAPPSSPAFVLMDITPSNIIIPENVQAFSIQTINAFTGNSEATNGNYAVEVQPYWYVKRESMNFFTYNNLTSSKSQISTVDDYDGINIFGDIWKKASFSLALMDGTFEVFEEPQSFISMGARTRLLSLRTKKQIDGFKEQYKRYLQFMRSQEVSNIFANSSLSSAEKNEKVTTLQEFIAIRNDFEEVVQSKPFFALDVALAYSHFLGDKSSGFEDTLGRFGVWASGDLALYTPTIGKNSYVHFYGIFRYLRDGINLEDNGTELFGVDKLDFGGKVELEFDRLSFAYEFIKRDSDLEEGSRSIGSIRYRINDAFAIHGGFGENFQSEGTTVALFGIQWGLENNSSVRLSPN